MKRIPLQLIALAAATTAWLAATAATADTPAAPASTPARSWAYQPVTQAPAVPAVHQARWVRQPLDAFVLARLEAKGLTPSPEADRATYIRRATLDTLGLLPTPEEVRAFVNDKSPKAYEKLVDRLLASPHYGERQGRRWLDLTRYADSDGYNADGTRPNIWRYRDYVIQAFNADKPFDQFVKEQIAGDEFWPQRKEALIATGFLRNFPDEINARDLNLKKQEVANDLTDTVSSVFLGSTIGCAQCHDHKTEKITQKEYYQLQAFFVNTSWHDDVSPLEGKALADYQTRLARWEAATQDLRAQQEALLKPVIDKLEADRLQGFTPATRAALEKPASDRDAYERWIYHRNLWTLSGRTRNAVNQLRTKDKPAYEKYQALAEELKQFDGLKPKDPGYISTIAELGPDAPPTRVLFKGIYDRPLDEVQPGFPALISSAKPQIQPTATSSGRRSALANWLVEPSNPLTARVFVNRQWAQFFGTGIVATPSDFGKTGARPTHPELLDYLSAQFVKQGWHVKALHREILLSATYRQASLPRPAEQIKADPDNKLLWAFPRQRLDAEELRDTLLQAAGVLDTEIGGPAVFPPLPANLDNRNNWVTSPNPHDHNRRSVYVFIRRNTPYPLLDTFDWANPQLVHSRREVTTTAPQALALVNSDLVFDWVRALAGRVQREGGASEAGQIDRLYEIVYARKPSAEEKRGLLAFLDQQQALTLVQAKAGKKLNVPDGFGVDPAVEKQVAQFYKTVYRREPDRYERNALVGLLDKQQLQAHQHGSGGGIGDPTVAPEDPAEAGGGANSVPPERRARAAAFVDLVQAVVSANEFVYRF